MKKIVDQQTLKMNFLEIWRGISPEDTMALLEFDKMGVIEQKLKKYCTKEYPMSRVLLVYHAYASIAYITAEIKVNAKIYLDILKKNFMILSYKKNSNPDTCSVVYSNIQVLCNYPFYPVPVKEIFEFIEDDNIIDGLTGFYEEHAK